MPLLKSEVPAPEKKASNWISYWEQDQLWAFSKIWEINARLFHKRTASILNISKKDQVLDIGCGAGHIAELLSPQVYSFHGVDTSETLLFRAEQRCAHFENTSFSLLLPQNANFGKTDQYSLFLCISVVQYYPDLKSVLALVENAKNCASPGARMLIGDIPEASSKSNGWRSFQQSIQEGYFLEYLKIIFQWFFSDYRKFTKKNPILEISAAELCDEISKLGYKATVIPQSISICAHRPSILIQF